MTIIIKRYGKEIEDQDCELMDEIFGTCDLMSEHYITQNQLHDYFVAFNDEDEVVGFLACSGSGRTVVTQVSDEYQNQGIGKALVKSAIEAGNEQAYLPRQSCK